LRRQIALTMEEAWRTVPHIFSMDSLDATALVSVRQRLNEDLAADGVKLSFLPFFVKACAAALRAEPRFNASLDMANERIHYHGRVNIGIATQTAEGLIVTVVHDADQLGLVDIAIEIEALAQAARDRKIRLEQLADATFSISNYGSYGGHLGTPIIRPPECAIAGFGRLHDAVVPRDGVPVVQPTLPFCVSADHRLNDGEDLGRFIDVMRRYLHDPIRLLGLR
jgi:pyruvate dehydrogenase E2 component (dihydrolipoamide acetyltransferase)